MSLQWRGYAIGLLSVLLVTVIIGALQPPWHIANISMLYLIGVLATATVAGSGPAIVASVAAFLAFNWFFVEPVHTLTVAEPSEWLALVLFLVTGVITGQLAGRQRRRALEAAQREREATLLYAVAHLLVGSDLVPALRAVADQLREGLRLRAVVIELDTDAGEQRVASGEAEVVRRSIGSIRTWMASPTPRTTNRRHRWIRIVPPTGGVAGDHRVHVVPLRSGEQRVGALAVVRGDAAVESANDRLLAAVAAQIGNAVERARLQERATQAEVLQRTDVLKTALLNAVSHDLRTPLASIIASAGSLRQQDVDWTDAERESFAADILEEATRLSRIVTNLLDYRRPRRGRGGRQRAGHRTRIAAAPLRSAVGRAAREGRHRPRPRGRARAGRGARRPHHRAAPRRRRHDLHLHAPAIARRAGAGDPVSATGARILVVDDEPAIVRAVRANLDRHGFRVDTAASAQEAIEHSQMRPDLILLDLGLPDGDGFEIIRVVREQSDTPIIVLSARGAERDKVRALDLGADDYLTKPFGLDELYARIRVALRHSTRMPNNEPVFRTGGLAIDVEHRRVTVEGEDVHLTPTEYTLLVALAKNADRVVTDAMLLREVWGPQYGDEDHYLHVYVARLRKKIERDPQRPRYLQTEPGVGYRLLAED